MQNADEPIYTYRITRKIRKGGSSCLALLLGLMGLVCCVFIVTLPLGLILLALGFMVDKKTAYVSHCDHCGNEVNHTCVLCPTCRADLAPEPRSLFRRIFG